MFLRTCADTLISNPMVPSRRSMSVTMRIAFSIGIFRFAISSPRLFKRVNTCVIVLHITLISITFLGFECIISKTKSSMTNSSIIVENESCLCETSAFSDSMYFGKLVHLRRIEPEDIDVIMKNWNNLEMRQYVAHAVAMSRAKEKEILERMSKSDPWIDGDLALAIEDKMSGEYLGSVGLHRISKQNRNAELGIVILDPKNFGKGYGTDAIKVVLWVGFNILGLESVYLSTFSMNKRGQKAFKSAGFKEAGVRRRGYFTIGEFRDIIIMDIVKEEFFERYPPGVTIEDAE